MLFKFATTPKPSPRLFKLFIDFLKQNHPTMLDKLVSFPITVLPIAGCIQLMLILKQLMSRCLFLFGWILFSICLDFCITSFADCTCPQHKETTHVFTSNCHYLPQILHLQHSLTGLIVLLSSTGRLLSLAITYITTTHKGFSVFSHVE